MRRTTLLALIGVLALSIGLPASAHPGHGSCDGGAPSAFEAGFLPVSPGPDLGEFVSSGATAGELAEFVAFVHDNFCD
ncbi:MAG TPA: hypothetical protein VF148_13170 [Acidimicrobiia bacterium]